MKRQLYIVVGTSITLKSWDEHSLDWPAVTIGDAREVARGQYAIDSLREHDAVGRDVERDAVRERRTQVDLDEQLCGRAGARHDTCASAAVSTMCRIGGSEVDVLPLHALQALLRTGEAVFLMGTRRCFAGETRHCFAKAPDKKIKKR